MGNYWNSTADQWSYVIIVSGYISAHCRCKFGPYSEYSVLLMTFNMTISSIDSSGESDEMRLMESSIIDNRGSRLFDLLFVFV